MKRRDFFTAALTGLVALPFISGEAIAKACKAGVAPAGKKILDIASNQAKRLKYVVLATTSKHKKYKAGANCANCNFYKTKKEDGGHAPCTMAGNKYVSACGWCKSYRKKSKKKA